MGFLDLEKHFAFYAAYHSNSTNICIHMIFVWPIFFTAVLLFNFIPAPFDFPYIDISLFGNDFSLVFNFGFLFSLIYAVFYVCFDYKVGSLAALLCIFCWISSSVLASVLGFQLAWKVVLVVQLVSWIAQFIGHGVFEGRAPALLDNILQAFLMAPFFVLFEALQILFGYEPYPGFHARVTAIVDAETEDWRNKKGKLLT
uniref:2-hydroxy-palmitic acid dioxygenase mpo1-like isoform X1 n=1 Tax=Erigeron canadensis TaxID=72917 RepID=UPI001CB9423D|nr:2-hydroxy-palmitic acid dioxygenase mpo1-like isoform X1 [Erigeron canadensis]